MTRKRIEDQQLCSIRRIDDDGWMTTMNKSDRNMHEEIDQMERWLSGYPTPAPSRECVQRARIAARQTLHEQHAVGAPSRWHIWHGSLVAAAAIFLAIGIGWYSRTIEEPSGWAMADRDLPWALPERSEEITLRLASLDEDLREVEDWFSDVSTSASGAAMYELMEEALSAPDEQPQSRGRDAVLTQELS